MSKYLLAALAVVLLTGSSRAAETYYHLVGEGMSSCEDWTADRHKLEEPDWYMKSNWVLGFLSGAAYTNPNYDPLRGMNARDVDDWVDNYCRANPLKTVADAAEAFAQEHTR